MCFGNTSLIYRGALFLRTYCPHLYQLLGNINISKILLCSIYKKYSVAIISYTCYLSIYAWRYYCKCKQPYVIHLCRHWLCFSYSSVVPIWVILSCHTLRHPAQKHYCAICAARHEGCLTLSQSVKDDTNTGNKFTVTKRKFITLVVKKRPGIVFSPLWYTDKLLLPIIYARSFLKSLYRILSLVQICTMQILE